MSQMIDYSVYLVYLNLFHTDAKVSDYVAKGT